MKRLLLIPLLFLLICGTTRGQDSLMHKIEDRISHAFVQDMTTGKPVAMNRLAARLETENKTQQQRLILYWQSYLQFYRAVYYLTQNDKRNAELEADKGVRFMEGVADKTSEDFALLSLLQGFTLQFKAMKAMMLAPGVRKSALSAISLDPKNPRAYFVYGSYDFYTPQKFGGGSEAEKYLLKAIGLPAQQQANPYLPAWGKEEAYELLIRLYLRQGKKALAQKYYREGTQAIPNSFLLNKLAPQLL